jgi:hypothetical protein
MTTFLSGSLFHVELILPFNIPQIMSYMKISSIKFEAERPSPPHHAHQELMMAAEESGEFFKSLLGYLSRFELE